jgi:hypothetical protein
MMTVALSAIHMAMYLRSRRTTESAAVGGGKEGRRQPGSRKLAQAHPYATRGLLTCATASALFPIVLFLAACAVPACVCFRACS